MNRLGIGISTLVIAAGLGLGCGKSDGGGGPDKLDVAALKAGSSQTAKLKFWMKERGVRGNGMADNVHFDDASNNRVVLYFDADQQAAVDKLAQNKVYGVTFEVEEVTGTKVKMITGTLTKID